MWLEMLSLKKEKKNFLKVPFLPYLFSPKLQGQGIKGSLEALERFVFSL